MPAEHSERRRGVGVDLARGCRVGVAEAGGDSCQRDAGVDHQRGVGMAQAVNGNVRQVVSTDEITEPTKGGTPKSPAFWGKEESQREQEGDFVEKSPSASTANDDAPHDTMMK